jgi:hypothetical protein
MGNPPFYGYYLQNEEQKKDMKLVFNGFKSAGLLDYVAAWYFKAALYIQENPKIDVAFVSTNSVTQGEQVAILWRPLIQQYGVKLFFAHKVFKWFNEARGNAAVHVVIIGFSLKEKSVKKLFDYKELTSEPQTTVVSKINPYLIEGNDVFVDRRTHPISNIPEIKKGSQPTDGGNLLLSTEERKLFLEKEPNSEKYIRPFVSAREFLQGKKRWCFWLKGIKPNELKKMPMLLERVEAVRQMRLKSKKASTQKWADFPTLFTEDRQPSGKYILVPRVSSERRRYIPMAFFEDNIIISDSCLSVNTNATVFHFGVLMSLMHMAWVKYTCGRLKSDYRYSNTIVYNNFPWPKKVSPAQKKKVESAAQGVLDARALFPESSLAELYDPLTMPPELLKAHQKLDKAVDSCYRPQPFPQERNRIEFLFELYEAYTAPLLQEEKKAEKRKKRQGKR